MKRTSIILTWATCRLNSGRNVVSLVNAPRDPSGPIRRAHLQGTPRSFEGERSGIVILRDVTSQSVLQISCTSDMDRNPVLEKCVHPGLSVVRSNPFLTKRRALGQRGKEPELKT
jgi:hypothetical protein